MKSLLKQGGRFLGFTMLGLLFQKSIYSQTGILLTYYDGTQQSFSIAASGKLYFQNQSLQVIQSDALSTVSIPVSIIRKINFSAVALPLQMVSFSLTNGKNQILLNWKTANEINTSHFIVERSVDGSAFAAIGQVSAQGSSAAASYTFTDQAPLVGSNFYRLKQVDRDNRFEFSKILSVNHSSVAEEISITPNPATGYFRVTGAAGGEVQRVKVYSSSGRVILAGSYNAGEAIPVAKLKPGVYLVSVNEKTLKLIKH